MLDDIATAEQVGDQRSGLPGVLRREGPALVGFHWPSVRQAGTGRRPPAGNVPSLSGGADLKTNAALRKAYLYKIATNLMTDHWRTSAREQRFVVTSHSDEEFHEEAASDQRDAAEAVIVSRDLSRVFSAT